MIPTAIPAPAALAQHKQKLAERSSGVKVTTPSATPANGRKSTGSKTAPLNGKNKGVATVTASAGPSTAASVEGTPDVPDERAEMDLS